MPPRPLPIRRPSAVPHVYSPGPTDAEGRGSSVERVLDRRMSDASMSEMGGVRSLDGSWHAASRADDDEPRRGAALAAEAWSQIQTPVRQHVQVGPRVRTPFGPKSANRLPNNTSDQTSDGAAEPKIGPQSVALSIRPLASRKRSSSGSGSITRRITRSAKDPTVAEEEGEVKLGGAGSQPGVGDERGGDGMAEQEGAARLATVAVSVEGGSELPGLAGSAISPRAHLKRKCTSPSFEGENGRVRGSSYIEVDDEVKEEEED